LALALLAVCFALFGVRGGLAVGTGAGTLALAGFGSASILTSTLGVVASTLAWSTSKHEEQGAGERSAGGD
jgi:hypothetical protein